MDLLGLCLIASCLGLILLPLGLAPTVKGGWSNPSMVRQLNISQLLLIPAGYGGRRPGDATILPLLRVPVPQGTCPTYAVA
jgi:hypothetical protein